MPIDIYILSIIIVLIVSLAALIVGCLYCYRAGFPDYLRIFPIYMFISIAAEVLANNYLRSLLSLPITGNQPLIRNISYNLFTLVEVFTFAYFLFQIIRSTTIKRITLALLGGFVIYFIISTIQEGLYQSNDLAILFEGVIIIILCLTFFRELFTRPAPVDLLREPSFWLVTGIFFYLATIFPLFLAGSYLRSHGLHKTAHTLYSINNFALSVTYLLFIKGYTCRTKRL